MRALSLQAKVVLPWLVAGAAFLLGLVGAASAFAPIAYEVRSERTNARALIEDETGAGGSYAYRYDTTRDGAKIVAVTYIEPLDASAAPPPGLAEWPAPGEAAVSPALVGSDKIAREYGPVTQVIGAEGLGSPTERLIYARPPAGALDIGMKTASQAPNNGEPQPTPKKAYGQEKAGPDATNPNDTPA